MRYLVFDTETTNLTKLSLQPISKQPHVVEFYGCIWDDKQPQFDDRGHPLPIEELEFISKPPVPCDPDAEAAHHITAEMLEGHPPFSTFTKAVRDIIESANGVVAHNLAYDYNVIEYEMKRCKEIVKWPIRRICTVENTQHLLGYRLSLGPKKDKMGLYHHLFGEVFPDAHRAKPDTMALLRCFVELLNRGVL